MLPENVSKSEFYTVHMSEMGWKVAKLVDSTQFLLLGPLIRPLIHQQVILEGPETPKRLHKRVLPENVSKSSFYLVISNEMGPKVAKLVNSTQVLTLRP